jgi:protein-tyrosine phosphatase
MRNTPIIDSYWVVPGRLLAGEYPGARTEEETRAKLRSFLDAGVSYFLDLTEEDEGHEPYEALLLEEAKERNQMVIYRRLAVLEQGAPATRQMREIQRVIQNALNEGHVIYVHCLGGVGRAGMVVGCYLIEQEMSAAEALAQIRRLRRETTDGWRKSPETRPQEEFVRNWQYLIARSAAPGRGNDFVSAAQM